MEAAEGVDIKLTTGSVFNETFILTEDDEGEVPADITGYAFQGQIRAYPDGPLIADITTAITSAVGGEILISVPVSVTSTLNAGSFAWDLFIKAGGTDEEVVIKGAVQITKGVTQWQ